MTVRQILGVEFKNESMTQLPFHRACSAVCLAACLARPWNSQHSRIDKQVNSSYHVLFLHLQTVLTKGIRFLIHE